MRRNLKIVQEFTKCENENMYENVYHNVISLYHKLINFKLFSNFLTVKVYLYTEYTAEFYALYIYSK